MKFFVTWAPILLNCGSVAKFDIKKFHKYFRSVSFFVFGALGATSGTFERKREVSEMTLGSNELRTKKLRIR